MTGGPSAGRVAVVDVEAEPSHCEDLSVFTRSLFMGVSAGSCDGRNLEDVREVQRARAHRRAWGAAATEAGGSPAVWRFVEAPAPPTEDADGGGGAWWRWRLEGGECDVAVLDTPHHYALHTGVVPALLAATERLEMPLAALWPVLHDLGHVRVLWRRLPRGGAPPPCATHGRGPWSCNVKRLVPNSPVTAYLRTVLLLLGLFVGGLVVATSP